MTDRTPAQNTAQEIADWFIAWAEYNGEVLTVQKLHMLVYFAQGHALGKTGEPLFDDEIVATKNGPFIPSLNFSATKPDSEG
jgi:uncharacterized phage-associated protein